MSVPQEEPLLAYLDAVVRTRRGSLQKLLRGRVCFGVRDSGRTRWWVADFLPDRVTTKITEQLPRQFDVGMAMDRQTALWALGAAEHKGDLHLSTGDQGLWKRFASAYLRSESWVSIRGAGAR